MEELAIELVVESALGEFETMTAAVAVVAMSSEAVDDEKLFD